MFGKNIKIGGNNLFFEYSFSKKFSSSVTGTPGKPVTILTNCSLTTAGLFTQYRRATAWPTT